MKQDTGSKILVRAVIIKNHKIYIDTELSIDKPGVFFMGGPTLANGDLILILENGYWVVIPLRFAQPVKPAISFRLVAKR